MKISLTAFLVAFGHLSEQEVDAQQHLRALLDSSVEFDAAADEATSLSVDMIAATGKKGEVIWGKKKSAKAFKSAKSLPGPYSPLPYCPIKIDNGGGKIPEGTLRQAHDLFR
mmetsp:Transcript_6988/g.10007  ORF Transcript_6988/g.10007 Transcript_6988/m.10007 type:complete len:112 (-) Transcript_6988:494-829(-)